MKILTRCSVGHCSALRARSGEVRWQMQSRCVIIISFDFLIRHESNFVTSFHRLIDNKFTSKFCWQQLNDLKQIAGSKMRQMFELVSSVGQQVAKTIKKRIENGGESTYEFKDLARRFTVDVSLADYKKLKLSTFSFSRSIDNLNVCLRNRNQQLREREQRLPSHCSESCELRNSQCHD